MRRRLKRSRHWEIGIGDSGAWAPRVTAGPKLWEPPKNPKPPDLAIRGLALPLRAGKLLAQPPPFSAHLATVFLALVGFNLLAVTLLSRPHRTQLLELLWISLKPYGHRLCPRFGVERAVGPPAFRAQSPQSAAAFHFKSGETQLRPDRRGFEEAHRQLRGANRRVVQLPRQVDHHFVENGRNDTTVQNVCIALETLLRGPTGE